MLREKEGKRFEPEAEEDVSPMEESNELSDRKREEESSTLNTP